MTNEERAQAYLMRLNGATIQDIADHYGVSKQYISSLMPPEKKYAQKNVAKNCVYPNIAQYMRDNQLTYHRFAHKCNINFGSIYSVLTGQHEPGKRIIDKILSTTGLKYEQAFYKGGKEEDDA